MAHSEPRMLVELLLEGQREPEDLDRLFGYIRGKTKGRFAAVKDIGDFNSHRHERDSGLSHGYALRFHDMFRTDVFVSAFGIPITMREHERSLKAALELVKDKIRDYSGVPYSRAVQLLSSIIQKAHLDQSGRFVISNKLTEQEARFWNALTTCPKHNELLTQDELMQQLAQCLLSEELLYGTERDAFLELSDWIAIYALSRMHFANILRSKGAETIARLEAMTNSDTGNLSVYILAEMGRLVHTRELFRTRCDPNAWCAPELLDTIHVDPKFGAMELKAHWSFPIRLNSAGKLVARREVDRATMERALYLRESPKRVS